MGYQVGVTPLQMVAAVSSIANGGSSSNRASYGRTYRTADATPSDRRSFGAPSAARPRRDDDIMEQVVTRGTAKLAQIPGFTVAGKTGTASKLIGGRYSAPKTTLSFVGFLPVARIQWSRSSWCSTPRTQAQQRRHGLRAHLPADCGSHAQISGGCSHG
jgi:cell division protein FtsI/penicillin-binding protein 2